MTSTWDPVTIGERAAETPITYSGATVTTRFMETGATITSLTMPMDQIVMTSAAAKRTIT